MLSIAGYIVVTKQNPFLKVYVQNILLSGITTSGAINIIITRVGESAACATYAPLAVNLTENSITFALDNLVLNKVGGRYVGELFYNGTDLGKVVFEYKNPTPVLVGSTDV